MNFSLPVEGQITSGFGWRKYPGTGSDEFHNGIDIAVPEGSPVKAAASGIVLKKYYSDSGGNQMVLRHANGYQTGYAHLRSFRKEPGDQVKKGETIALSGSTGHVTGPHLHFTVTNKKDEKIDPVRALTSMDWVQWTIGGGIILLIVLIILFVRKFKITK
ncbi:MAG: M23 family metallopeptidase [Bacteroidota bacterium]